MHAEVTRSLEEYLDGELDPATQRAIEAHISVCGTCREELRGMREVSEWLGTLQPEEAVKPAPGFYARVMQEVGEGRRASPFTSLFSLNPAFGRMLAFASLVTLAILGSYFISTETGYSTGPSPETVMAQQDLPSFDASPGADNMLITLTAYEQH
jgi:anti-sigma factor RsiW